MLIFRVDSGEHIGLGHLSRCLTLADAWPGRSLFVSRAFAGNGLHWLDGRHDLYCLDPPEATAPPAPPCDPWLRVPTAADADATIAALANVDEPSVLVVDHYGIDAAWHRRVGAARADLAVAAIDDLADRALWADVVLDQSPGRDGADYAQLVAPWTRVLTGSRFALLRPEFRAHRWRDGSDRILLSLGGLDTAGHHGTVLGFFADLRESPAGALRFEVDLPISSAAPHLPLLREAVERWPWLHLHVDCTDMARLMAGARLAVGAPGTSALERCAVGVPSVQVVVADNQRHNAAALAGAGAAVTVELGDAAALAAAVRRVWGDPSARAELSRKGRELCDGDGAGRVVEALTAAVPVTLEPMGPADRDQLFAWQCEPGARTYARTTEAPTAEEHARWFSAALAMPGRHLWTVLDGAEPVGMVRWDEADREVSILLAAAARGRGVGVRALRALQRQLPDQVLRAEIHVANVASRRVFERAGYHPVDETWFRLDPPAPAGAVTHLD